MKTILKILDHSDVYKQVFREVSLLEVLITCLHRFAVIIKESQSDPNGKKRPGVRDQRP